MRDCSPIRHMTGAARDNGSTRASGAIHPIPVTANSELIPFSAEPRTVPVKASSGAAGLEANSK